MYYKGRALKEQEQGSGELNMLHEFAREALMAVVISAFALITLSIITM